MNKTEARWRAVCPAGRERNTDAWQQNTERVSFKLTIQAVPDSRTAFVSFVTQPMKHPRSCNGSMASSCTIKQHTFWILWLELRGVDHEATIQPGMTHTAWCSEIGSLAGHCRCSCSMHPVTSENQFLCTRPYRVGLRAQANFSAPTFEPAHEARAGKRAALSVYLSQLQLRCSNLITGPQASSSRSELSA